VRLALPSAGFLLDGAALSGTRGYLALLALCLALFVPGLGALPPLDRDEARFAQATRQMIETGDVVDIRYQEVARHNKPVGIYWLQALSAVVVGGGDADAPIWAYRLPSLLGAVAAVLLTAWCGTLLFGPAAGFAGAVLLALSVMLGAEARLAKTDAGLLATIVAAQAVLARAYLAAHGGVRPQAGAALVFWGALGLGLLIKGPIILMVVGLTALPLCLVERRWRWLGLLRPWPWALIALAIVLPWLILITLKTDGGFFADSVGRDLAGKVGEGQESHGAPPGYYLASLWLSFWPGTLLLLPALPFVWRNRRDPAVRFCLAWIVPTWLVFELIATKLPHYVLPTFPALALLAAAALAGRERAPATRGERWLLIAGALLWAIAGAAVAIALPILPGRIGAAPDVPTIVVGALVVLLFGFVALPAVWRAQTGRALATLGAGALVLYGVIYQHLFPSVAPLWSSAQAAAAVREARPCATSGLAAAGYAEPSLVFLTGTATRLVRADAAADFLLADPACALALIEDEARPAFEARLAEAGASARALRRVSGYNYSKGDPVGLTLFTLAPAP
jgi:4-amino-4-deoxy-L-arabinose transferase-like glycosyltransferase